LGVQAGDALSPSDMTALQRYADAIGLAFQVVDDLLDVEGATAVIGKSAGKDAANDKPTFVSLLGLAAAKERAEALRADARDALVPFGDRARRLGEITHWIVDRQF